METVTLTTAPQIIAELEQRGYSLEVSTRVEITRHKVGEQHVTYADQLIVTGPERLSEGSPLRAAITAYRPELLAAVCVKSPPIPWVWTMVSRYLDGTNTSVRRQGWKGRTCVSLSMLSAHVASFVGLDPAREGPRLAPIIKEVLRCA